MAPPEWFERADAFRRPDPGPGLFIQPRAKQSTRQVCRAALENGLLEGLPSTELKTYRKQVASIAQKYWADWDYENRATLSEVKGEAAGLATAAGRLLERIASLSQDARIAINDKIIWDGRKRAYEDHFSGVLVTLTRIRNASDGIAKGRNTKKAYNAVRNCCSSLWDFRERITNRPFKRSFIAGRSSDSRRRTNVDREFAADDANFVLTVMHAIDSGVGFKTVRTKLMELGKTKPKSQEP